MKLTDLPPEFRERLVRERQKIRAAVDLFVSGARGGDGQAVCDAFEQMEVAEGAFRAAFLRIARYNDVPGEFRLRFLQFWMSVGDSIRSHVNDDIVLISGLKALLPRYQGPATTLYRGEGARNRSRRTYGISWSASRDVADSHARKSLLRSGTGGSVLLRVEAPANAILCAVPDHHEDRYGELEYLVDRRQLPRVEVLARYCQVAERGGGDAPYVILPHGGEP